MSRPKTKSPRGPVQRSVRNIGRGCAIFDLARHPVFGTRISALAADAPPKPDKLIMLHIPRTGGSAMLRALDEWYCPGKLLDTFAADEALVYSKLGDFVSRVREAPQTCIHVHLPYPVDQALVGPWRYITLLRHPVERVVSQYRIVREATLAGHRSFLGSAEGSLQDYLDAHPQYTADTQAKYLLNLEKFGADVQDTCERPVSVDPDEAVETCVGVLKRKFAFVGVTEMWSASVLAFSLAMGRTEVPLMYDFMRSVDRYEPTASELASIRDRNRIDLALYRKAKAGFLRTHGKAVAFLRDSGAPELGFGARSDPWFAGMRPRRPAALKRSTAPGRPAST